MKANIKPWFMLNGRKNTDMGVELLGMPTRPISGRGGEKRTVPGRDGFLWEDEDRLLPGTIKLKVVLPDNDGMDAAAAWLSESGLLVFSDEPDRAWHVMCVRDIARASKHPRLLGQVFTVTWDCQPCRYIYPQPADQYVSNGSMIYNPGTADALPEITVVSSGEFSLIVNGRYISADSISGTSIIDCDAQEVFNADRTQLRNSLFAIDDFPRLKPGSNAVSWTGAVSSVKISCPWRYL